MRKSKPRSWLIPAMVIALLPVLPGPPAAAEAGVTLSKTSVDSAPDFASQRYADAWDFDNREDLSLEPLRAGGGLSNLGYNNSAYNATVRAGGSLALVTTVPGQLPYGRDGQAIPIDANQYTRLSFRMWSNTDDVAQVWWSNCPEANTACYGATQFLVHAGWGVYDVALSKLPSTAANWAGSMDMIRIDPLATRGGSVSLDWVRLYQPAAPNPITVTGDGSAEVLIDLDTAPGNGNETTLRRDDSTLRTDGAGRATIDTSLLPPGTYYLGTRTASNGTSYARTPLTVNGPPMPVVLDPDIAGGTEVHDLIGGSPWDFNEGSDVASTYNISGGVSGGVYSGRNSNPDPGDNQINLSMPGVIDGSTFHRLTFKISYDGPWGLQEAPGGGMLARVLWNVRGSSDTQISNDIVVLPGSQTVSVDLAANSALVLDETQRNRIGWAGQGITALRFDPNEDPGTARTWQLDDIRLARDDSGENSFSVRFQDANWAPGTVADIYVDRGAPGQNRTAVAGGIPVNQGVNAYNWNLGALPDGTYWVVVNMRRGSTSGSAISTGPVQMKTAVPAPLGRIDSLYQVGSDGVAVSGWALDPVLGGEPTWVQLYVDGRGVSTLADGSRPDIAAAFGQGAGHGFSYRMNGVGPGPHNVCIYAYRASGSVLLSCQQLTITADTTGVLDAVGPVTGGIRATGWSLDRSTAASNLVHVYVDNRVAAGGWATRNRPDIAAAFAGYGPAHGFAVTAPSASGTHQVCAFGLDAVAPGRNASLGCRDITVPSRPFGVVDAIGRSGNTISVRGWVIDPRRTSGTAAHIYVDGVGAANVAVTDTRQDVNAAYPGYAGSDNGFAEKIKVGTGSHQVCVYGVGAEGPTLLRCQNL